jgi:hypothetical protein
MRSIKCKTCEQSAHESGIIGGHAPDRNKDCRANGEQSAFP